MDLFDFLNFLCGLALFLFGMFTMGDGLENCAGGRLRSILERLTASPVRGFFLGFLVTAIIQSSSATTVMVVGLVNSGVMSLHQAVGLIMGANVGTTVTAWLISLTSIDGAAFFLQLLRPAAWVPLLALLGVYFMRFERSGRKKGLAAILLGFAVLMVGMDTMSASVEVLRDVPAFSRIFTLFSHPLAGILVGVVVTAVMQSSSASVGVLQALSVTGGIRAESAIPLILGMNIGAVVPTLLSAVGARVGARRAAAVHLYINLIGAALFLIPYALLRRNFLLPFLEEAVNPVSIALIHSGYKLGCALVLLPFCGALERLAVYTVRDQAGSAAEAPLLDERLMATPSVALSQAKRLTGETALMAQEAFEKALSLLERWDAKTAGRVRELEDAIDQREDALGTYLVQLSGLGLSIGESQDLSTMLHTISDFERISDHAVDILLCLQEVGQRSSGFSEGARQELRLMAQAVTEALELTIVSFRTGNLDAARQVEPLGEVVERMGGTLRAHHIDRLRAGRCSVETGVLFTDLVNCLGRVSAHCSNIAACVVEMQHSSYDPHQYVRELHRSDPDYAASFARFSAKYAL